MHEKKKNKNRNTSCQATYALSYSLSVYPLCMFFSSPMYNMCTLPSEQLDILRIDLSHMHSNQSLANYPKTMHVRERAALLITTMTKLGLSIT